MNQVQKFLTKLYRGVGTEFSLNLLKFVEKAEWRSIQSISIGSPSSYESPSSYLLDTACVEIIRKCKFDDKSQEKELEDKALETFFSCEADCFRTNARLTRFIDNQGPFRDSVDIRVADFINLWRKEVSRVLGKCPHLLEPTFSGGSTLSDAGKLTTIPDKMSSTPTWYARGDKTVFTDAFSHTPFARKEWVVVKSNRFFTVPKDNFKNRGCGLEASLNVMLQLAVGKLLKKRYRAAYQIDLAQAQSLHRDLARQASAGVLDLATIDLSNASDTIARELVRLLLPSDWYELLNSLRATYTKVGDRVIRLEKFSSMGNGFTFELETIIFKSLATIIAGANTFCYGDDIICPTSRAGDLIAALRFFGFKENPKKTFCEGPFRESCGGDYFDGVPVRAHYLKKPPDGPSAWMALANGLRRMDPELTFTRAAWRYCVDQIPTMYRVFGPEHLGDLVIHDPEARPTSHSFKTVVGGKAYKSSPSPAWRVYRPISQRFPLGEYWTAEVALAAASLGVPSEVIPRDSVVGYKLDWVCAWGRNDLFGWCGSEASVGA